VCIKYEGRREALSKPLLIDLNDFVTDLNDVVEDQLVRMGFERGVARGMVIRMSGAWQLVLSEEMQKEQKT
jgi:hypothetical protein